MGSRHFLLLACVASASACKGSDNAAAHGDRSSALDSMGGTAGTNSQTSTVAGAVKGARTGRVPPFHIGDGVLELGVCAAEIVRVTYSLDPGFASRSTLATAPKDCDASAEWVLEEAENSATLSTARLRVEVDLTTGALSFLNAAGEAILAERERRLLPVEVQGESTFNVQQTWDPNQDEAFYGLGQHQQNLLNIKDVPLSLVQYNTQIVVPMVVSSRGYGILWDNTSWTRWGDLAEFESLNGGGGAWEGQFTAAVGGEHLLQTYSSGQIELRIDGQTVIEHWRQGWLPDRDYARVWLEAGQTVSLALSFTPDIGVEIADLAVKPPASEPVTSLWSHVGEGVDYTFVYGPEIDDVVRGYRRVTGKASMLPKWAFGLWQCRERYTSAQQLLDVLAEFRRRGIPLDNIVQDWQYWVPDSWGSHEFDATRFPDPAGFVEQIHDHNAQLMISVWPKFHAGTDNYAELDARGFIYPRNALDGIEDFQGYPMGYYDAFDAEARELYWSQMREHLFVLGVDAWWMDGTEPEVVEGPYLSPAEHRQLYQDYMHPTALGSGSRMLNAYSLVNSQAVYEGQRAAAPDQRVFILTRSAFAGQQRYGSVSWSGDITSTRTALKKQVPAGLGFSVSGIPYWTMDVGGFAVPERFATGNSDEWYELNTRWFQYGTFVPLLRVHGQAPVREMWTMGGDEHPAFQTHVKFDRLRYRLLPYVYSLAGVVTHEGGTMMRPLVMDFRTDPAVRDIQDQYMFGPAFLVNPVTSYQARSREVTLPRAEGGWYDFWTGAAMAGAQSFSAPAPLESLPLYVRAGSIVPFGPELEYTGQKPADPITLYVYTGADGEFVLYEDDGKSYAYEGGALSRISLAWSEASRTLSLSARQGEFEGMLAERRFDVVFVSEAAPVGFGFEPVPHASVTYTGQAIDVAMP